MVFKTDYTNCKMKAICREWKTDLELLLKVNKKAKDRHELLKLKEVLIPYFGTNIVMKTQRDTPAAI